MRSTAPYSDDAQNTQSSSRNHVHVWRFDTWYSKLLGVVILLIVVFLLFHILVAVIPFCGTGVDFVYCVTDKKSELT